MLVSSWLLDPEKERTEKDKKCYLVDCGHNFYAGPTLKYVGKWWRVTNVRTVRQVFCFAKEMIVPVGLSRYPCVLRSDNLGRIVLVFSLCCLEGDDSA